MDNNRCGHLNLHQVHLIQLSFDEITIERIEKFAFNLLVEYLRFRKCNLAGKQFTGYTIIKSQFMV